MAFSPSVDWDGDFKENPKGTGSRSLGDDKFRDSKAAFRERFSRSHRMSLSTDNDLHGIHRAGSGKSAVEETNPSVNSEGSPVLGITGYLNTKKMTDGIPDDGTYAGIIGKPFIWQLQSYTGAAWAGMQAPIPADALDTILSADLLYDTSANVHTSTIITWVRSYLGGDYHGYISATGAIGGEPIHGIRYVTTGMLIYHGLSGTKTILKTAGTSFPAALLMIDSR